MDGQNMNNQQSAPAQQPYAQPYQQQPYAQPYQQYAAPGANEMSVGAWVGVLLLTCIPIVNLICLIIWAVSSDPTRIARKRWAIAQLIIVLVVTVLSIAFSGLIMGTLASLM